MGKASLLFPCNALDFEVCVTVKLRRSGRGRKIGPWRWMHSQRPDATNVSSPRTGGFSPTRSAWVRAVKGLSRCRELRVAKLEEQ